MSPTSTTPPPFDGALHYGRSLVPVMHPYVIGRPGRLRMLERLIQHMQESSGVTFMRAVDVAEPPPRLGLTRTMAI